MIIKVHKTLDGRRIAAVCDKDILGKKFQQKTLQLDLTSSFYRGHEKSEEEILDVLLCSDVLNLVGEKSVGLALRNKLIDKGNIIRIKNIPHAQALRG